MKRFLLSVLLQFAITALIFGSTQVVEGRVHGLQDQKAATNYDIYVGQYEVAKDFILTITHENGKLMGQPTADEKAEFKPQEGPDEFYSSTVGARLRFAKNPEGAVIAVVVTIEGKDFYSKKIK